MDLNIFEIPTTVALSIMALVGYVFGVLPQRRKKAMLNMQRDLAQARMAVSELEKVVSAIHRSTAKHYSRLKRLQNRLANLSTEAHDDLGREVYREVEQILGPAIEFVGEIASAQECLRHHNTQLMRFSEMQTDPLTGLNNRRALDMVLRAQFGQLRRYGVPFSLLMLDIDHFKCINDEQGHLHGDETLRSLSALLLKVVRVTDSVVRYGGDEFVVVMPQSDHTGAGDLAERLRGEIAKALTLTVSVGVASATDADTAESLFERADAALYCAKNEGRNRVCCHNGNMIEAIADDRAFALPYSPDVLQC